VLNCLHSAGLRLEQGHEEEEEEEEEDEEAAVRIELAERAVVDLLMSQLEWLDKASLVFFARFVAGGGLPAGTDSNAA